MDYGAAPGYSPVGGGPKPAMSIFSWLGQAIQNAVNAVIQTLTNFFGQIMGIFAGLVLLLEDVVKIAGKLGLILVLLVQLLFAAVTAFVDLILGLAIPASTPPGATGLVFSWIQSGIPGLQDLGYLAAVVMWGMVAYGLVRLIGSFAPGGG